MLRVFRGRKPLEAVDRYTISRNSTSWDYTPGTETTCKNEVGALPKRGGVALYWSFPKSRLVESLDAGLLRCDRPSDGGPQGGSLIVQPPVLRFSTRPISRGRHQVIIPTTVLLVCYPVQKILEGGIQARQGAHKSRRFDIIQIFPRQGDAVEP